MKGFQMDKTERELAPARALEDDPDGRDVAILDSVCHVRLVGIMVVCNLPRARHDSARAGGIRK
jgi:hypothetical protein